MRIIDASLHAIKIWLPLCTCTYCRTRRKLASSWNRSVKPFRHSSTKHCSITFIRSNCYIRSPRTNRRKPKRSNYWNRSNNPTSRSIHIIPRCRVRGSTIHNGRRSLRISILLLNWIPRNSRNHWDSFHCRWFLPIIKLPPNRPPPLRFRRSNSLLALCGRCMAIPIRFCLLVGIIIILTF